MNAARKLSGDDYAELMGLVSALTAACRNESRVFVSEREQKAATEEYELAFKAVAQWVADRTVFR